MFSFLQIILLSEQYKQNREALLLPGSVYLFSADAKDLTDAEIDALKAEFGERHAVCRRTLYSGWYDASRQTLRPAEFTIAAGTGENARRRAARP